MSKSERARSQPEGAQRKAPGRGSDGDYYHVAVRNKSQFKTFRTHDVGDPGGIQRVAGQRKSGTWGTVKWLIPKEWAHMKGGKLIADSDDARKVLEQLGSAPVHSSAEATAARRTRSSKWTSASVNRIHSPRACALPTRAALHFPAQSSGQ